jgi:hypothetical protein
MGYPSFPISIRTQFVLADKGLTVGDCLAKCILGNRSVRVSIFRKRSWDIGTLHN